MTKDKSIKDLPPARANDSTWEELPTSPPASTDLQTRDSYGGARRRSSCPPVEEQAIQEKLCRSADTRSRSLIGLVDLQHKQ